MQKTPPRCDIITNRHDHMTHLAVTSSLRWNHMTPPRCDVITDRRNLVTVTSSLMDGIT